MGQKLATWNETESLHQAEIRLHEGLHGALVAYERITSGDGLEDTDPMLSSLAKGVTAPRNSAPVSESQQKSASTRDPWPKLLRLKLPKEPRILIIKEDPVKKEWIYQSEHFDFVSNASLRPHVIREFASLFELTHLYCQMLPFKLSRPEAGEKLQVQLIENYTHYIARGGMVDSWGVYLSDRDLVLVPFEGLGLKKNGGSYSLDVRRSNQTLIHEATHMLMRGPLLRDGWFVEGVAEYVSTIPMAQNTLLIANHLSSVKNYITSVGYKGRGGHDLGTEITLTSLKKFMEADYDTYQKTPNAYPYALLVFHYFVHSDGRGDAKRIREYVQALYDGKSSRDARKILLGGRSYRTLETQIAASWKKQGITLKFQ